MKQRTKHELRTYLEDGYVETWCGERVYMSPGEPTNDGPQHIDCRACIDSKADDPTGTPAAAGA